MNQNNIIKTIKIIETAMTNKVINIINVLKIKNQVVKSSNALSHAKFHRDKLCWIPL
jgi:hypothetical protein